MSYNIMRTQKLKDRAKVTSAASHNFRLRHQGNIDASRSQLNQVLVNNLNANLNVAEGLQEALTGHYKALGSRSGRTVFWRKSSSYRPVRSFRGLKPEQVEIWAKHQVKFMRKEFGDNVQVAVLHLDEATPHLHFLLSCEEKSLKRYKNQKGEFFKETYSLNANRWGPDFLVDLHGTPSTMLR